MSHNIDGYLGANAEARLFTYYSNIEVIVDCNDSGAGITLKISGHHNKRS